MLHQEFFDTARNPALRTLIDELQQHSNHLDNVWRFFLRAMAASVGVIDVW